MSRVLYIEHLDLTNFNLFFTPQCRAVYSYGTKNSQTGEQKPLKTTVHVNFILFSLFGVHLLSHVEIYSGYMEIYFMIALLDCVFV